MCISTCSGRCLFLLVSGTVSLPSTDTPVGLRLPLSDNTAEAVAKAFVSVWVARFGCPQQITTDQGRQFEAHIFKTLATITRSSLTRANAWHGCMTGLLSLLPCLVCGYHLSIGYCGESARRGRYPPPPTEGSYGRRFWCPWIFVLISSHQLLGSLSGRARSSKLILQLLLREGLRRRSGHVLQVKFVFGLYISKMNFRLCFGTFPSVCLALAPRGAGTSLFPRKENYLFCYKSQSDVLIYSIAFCLKHIPRTIKVMFGRLCW